VSLLEVEDLGHRFEEEPWPQTLKVGRQALAVVAQPLDVGHDPACALATKGTFEAGVLAADPVRRTGQVERHYRYAKGL
jgi:hypothetical protein